MLLTANKMNNAQNAVHGMSVEELKVKQHNVESRVEFERIRLQALVNQSYWNGVETVQAMICERPYVPDAFKALVVEIINQHRIDYEKVMNEYEERLNNEKNE